jgi:hypothetical protein
MVGHHFEAVNSPRRLLNYTTAFFALFALSPAVVWARLADRMSETVKQRPLVGGFT